MRMVGGTASPMLSPWRQRLVSRYLQRPREKRALFLVCRKRIFGDNSEICWAARNKGKTSQDKIPAWPASWLIA